MHARVLSGTFNVGRWNEALRFYQEEVVIVTRKQPGFKAVMALFDQSTGRGMSITLWDTKEAMQKGVLDGTYSEKLVAFADFLVTAPAIESFTVGAFEVA